MKMFNSLILLIILIILITLSVLSIFFTGLFLYFIGELFYFLYDGIPINFMMSSIFMLCRISLGTGCFIGGGMWIARLLKLKGF